jgi:hypothetical protein
MAPLSVDARTPTKRWLKRIMHRLTKWETDPLIWQVNALRSATVEVAERLAERAADGSPADAEDDRP